MKRVCWIVVLAVVLFWIGWGLTAKEQEANMAWGALITVADVESAKLFGLETPGAYVGLKNGNALPAVRGGLKLIFTLQDPGLGFRAISNRMFVGVEGFAFTATLLLWVLAIAALVVLKVRGKPAPVSP